jgi:hypothetical protein
LGPLDRGLNPISLPGHLTVRGRLEVSDEPSV